MAKVLVVDDEKNICITLQKFLQAAGHAVELAEDASRALRLLHEATFDVVVTDIVLPGMSGIELLHQIRETTPSIQVIMMTGEPTMETVADALRHAASDYLAKPVSKNALLRSVGNAVRLKRIDDERRALITTLTKQYEKIERMAQTREDLFHLLRHDVANTVSGAVAMLQRHKRSIEQYARCEQALLNMLGHCESVITEIRTTEAESCAEPEPEPTDLRTLIDESLATLGAMAAVKAVHIRVRIEPGVTILVKPGPFILHVLNNVLSNAIKFSYPGGAVEVDARTGDTDVTLWFRDHGCGISEARVAKLFEQPLSTLGTAGEPGTGYGLRHAQRCMESMGGSVEVSSTERDGDTACSTASGTTVTVRVPRPSSAGTGGTVEPAAAGEGNPHAGA